MKGFTEILERATAAVTAEYFLLPLDGADSVYRERVYCYELYHQMRRLWPEDEPYRLNGEVDKRNHPYFQDPTQPKPDMIVHRPGTGDNFAAVEVKAAGAENRKITKDLRTLALFAKVGYRRLIYLIYGEDAERDVERVRACAAQLEGAPPIELWLHLAPDAAAFLADVLISAA